MFSLHLEEDLSFLYFQKMLKHASGKLGYTLNSVAFRSMRLNSIITVSLSRGPCTNWSFLGSSVVLFTGAMYENRKGTEIGQLSLLEMALNIHEKNLQFQKLHQIAKSGKYETFYVS